MKGIITIALLVCLFAFVVAEKDSNIVPTKSSSVLDCDKSHNSTCTYVTYSSSKYAASSTIASLTRSDLHEAQLRRPHQQDPKKASPIASATATAVIADTNENVPDDQVEEESSEGEHGLSKIHYAVMTIGGVLVVAGITAGIFVWRSVQRRSSSQRDDENNSGSQSDGNQNDERTASNKSEILSTGFYSELELHNRLDFGHSLEKIFDSYGGYHSPAPSKQRIQVSLVEAQDRRRPDTHSMSIVNLHALREESIPANFNNDPLRHSPNDTRL